MRKFSGLGMTCRAITSRYSRKLRELNTLAFILPLYAITIPIISSTINKKPSVVNLPQKALSLELGWQSR